MNIKNVILIKELAQTGGLTIAETEEIILAIQDSIKLTLGGVLVIYEVLYMFLFLKMTSVLEVVFEL